MNSKQVRPAILAAVVALAGGFNVGKGAATESAPLSKRVILIAGPKSHAPGEHEYLKSVKLLKVLLDRAPNLKGVRSEVHFNGWPDDGSVLDLADTIVIMSDGDDGSPPDDIHAPFMREERMKVLEKEMRRGCGLVTFHFSTFSPVKYAPQILEWTGGYFDWQSGHGEGSFYFGPDEQGPVPTWYSSIRTVDADVQLATPRHEIVRGISDFHLRDEFYYRIAFRPNDPRLQPILRVPILSPVSQEQIVAWAVQRKDGGRGFATTTGHYFDNWQNDAYRKLILNSLVWTARVRVPEGGVESTYMDAAEVDRVLEGSQRKRSQRKVLLPRAE